MENDQEIRHILIHHSIIFYKKIKSGSFEVSRRPISNGGISSPLSSVRLVIYPISLKYFILTIVLLFVIIETNSFFFSFETNFIKCDGILLVSLDVILYFYLRD